MRGLKISRHAFAFGPEEIPWAHARRLVWLCRQSQLQKDVTFFAMLGHIQAALLFFGSHTKSHREVQDRQ